jgi:hypothetical protein
MPPTVALGVPSPDFFVAATIDRGIPSDHGSRGHGHAVFHAQP